MRSPVAVPAALVANKTVDFQVFIDYRRLNAIAVHTFEKQLSAAVFFAIKTARLYTNRGKCMFACNKVK